AGVIRVDRAEELFEFGAILAGQPVPATDGVGIVTNAGGPGVMATDAIGDAGLELADFSEETIEALDDVLPSAANRYNPVDVIGDADAERFRRTMETVATDPSVGSLLVVACPSAPLSFEELADGIVDLAVEIDVPIVSCLMGGPTTREATDALAEADIPSYFDPARAVASLDALRRYRKIQSREYQTPQRFDVDRQTARDVLERVHETGDNRLGVEAMELLDAYGIPTPVGGIVDSPAAARDLAESIDGDVVMKIVSPDILHKTDIGGVEVGVADADVEDTYEDLVTRARAYQSDARLLGVQVQELVDVDAGVETIVGTTRDPQFGQLVLFGLGGIFVEVFEDTTLRVTPVTEQEAESMIDDLQAAPLLRGARGTDPVAEAEIVEVIQRLSQFVSDFPAILELDINPLVATPDGVFAVDLRLTADPEEL
ncbi:MAG: acetate--CoA ligase family protein, partial [Natronomonas sp.]